MAERELDKQIRQTEITEELKQSYLDYAMSVIVGRALPDVRDGLKPVHRRVLWAMWDSGVTHSSRYKKSANIVGEVMGRYHPHGDSAIYDSVARMAQDFSLRYPLIDGQGNWGNIDGDPVAAMRYTECRLAKISEAILTDIEKETVDFTPTYDDSRKEPTVLPVKFPNLLVNGSDGIAVGMATKIPPHNLGEVVDATIHLADNPKATSEDLMEFIKGPDFPTGGTIYDSKAIKEAYASGRGKIQLRAKVDVGEKQIVVNEIPYQVNKSDLLVKMAQLFSDKKLEGVKDIRDESDRDQQVRVVIDLKDSAIPQKIMNQLWKHTDLQKDFHLNMVALADGIKPETMSIKDVLVYFIDHRKDVVTRRTKHELGKAEERAHILEGLSKALKNIDAVIETIKKSSDRDKARENLMKKFELTELQTNAILEMRLQTLSGLETKKIEEELKEKRVLIKELKELLGSEKKMLGVIKDELKQVKEDYGDDRRTNLITRRLKDLSVEDLIPEEEAVIIMSGDGYIKRLSPDIFRSQKRGGKGLIGSAVGEEDILAHIIGANTHDNILFFTDKGRVFKTKVYEIPEGGRTSRGRAIHNFLELPSDEGIATIITYKDTKEDKKDRHFAMATAKGIVKRTELAKFDNVRRSGIIAIKLNKGDSLGWVKLMEKNQEAIIATKEGKSIRFKGSDVRAMGRSAAGVKGISLKKDDEVSSFDIIEPGTKANFLVVMENGYAKRTKLSEYKVQKRGGTGIVTAKVTPKTGKVVSSHVIIEEDELLAISTKGQVLKSKIKDIRQTGRATQGVKIISLKKGDKIAGTVAL